MTGEPNGAVSGREVGTGAVLTDQVVHETIDGETVVIDLASGSYFSLEGSAALAWERLVLGEDLATTARLLAERYGAEEPCRVRGGRCPCIDELYGAGLLRERPNAIAPAAATTFA